MEALIRLTQEELEEYGIDVDSLSEQLSETISKKTDYCHNGFHFTILIKADLDTSE